MMYMSIIHYLGRQEARMTYAGRRYPGRIYLIYSYNLVILDDLCSRAIDICAQAQHSGALLPSFQPRSRPRYKTPSCLRS
jgi:hypothetical protein